jgi:hypothetical protein
MAEKPDVPARSYGCTYGCGNPYDYVLIDVQGSEVLLLCVPCFIRTAMDMVTAVVEKGDPEVEKRVAEGAVSDQAPMTGRAVAKRGHEAPGDVDDENAIETFESYVLEDEVADILGS